MLGQPVEAFRSWGKHFLVELPDFALRVHFMLFGSYRINEGKSWAVPRLALGFDDGEINFYACSVRFIEEPLDLVYDWWADVMSEHWDPALARRRLRARPDMLVDEARNYSFDFYEWKKQYVLKKHWLAHTRRTCPRCDIPFVKAHLGRTQRRSFYCENCQVRYA